MAGSRLTSSERRAIEAGLAGGLSYAEIGRRLGRATSTVLREVVRNGGPLDYRPVGTAAPRRPGRHPRRRSGPLPSPEQLPEFVGSFTSLLVSQGMPRVAAGVLAQLYVTESGTLTAADLTHRLDVSAASISSATAYLREQGLLSRRRRSGDRRDHYVVDDEMWHRSIEATIRQNQLLIEAACRGAALFASESRAGDRFRRSADLLSAVNGALIDGLSRRQRPHPAASSRQSR